MVGFVRLSAVADKTSINFGQILASLIASDYELGKQKFLFLIFWVHVYVQMFLNDLTESTIITFSGSCFYSSITA